MDKPALKQNAFNKAMQLEIMQLFKVVVCFVIWPG